MLLPHPDRLEDRPASQAREREDLVRRLGAHPMYAGLRDVEALRVFLEHHVVCVLDFMTLLKRLQGELTCATTPWVPAPDPASARLINEIVLDEETDLAFGPHPESHYRWYLAAMDQVGADAGPIRRFEDSLRAGDAPLDALAASDLPPASREFARTTFELASGAPHVVAAAFLHGREAVIPRMFVGVVRELRASGVPCDLLISYLERHIEVDDGDHGPAAERLLTRLIDGREDRRDEAHATAMRALEARRVLWTAVQRAYTEQRRASRPATLFSVKPV